MFRRRLLSRHKKYYRISTRYDDLVQNVRRVFVCINGFPFHIVRTLLPMSVNASIHKLVDNMEWIWTPFTVSNIRFYCLASSICLQREVRKTTKGSGDPSQKHHLKAYEKEQLQKQTQSYSFFSLKFYYFSTFYTHLRVFILCNEQVL